MVLYILYIFRVFMCECFEGEDVHKLVNECMFNCTDILQPKLCFQKAHTLYKYRKKHSSDEKLG